MDLKTFLLARIEEDEAVAREAVDKDGRWHVDQRHPLDEAVVQGDIHIYDEGGHTAGQALHIARHDPARVLAECAAKRAIVEQAEDATGLDMSVDNDRLVGERDMKVEPYCGDVILAALAAVYADHPDYQKEW